MVRFRSISYSGESRFFSVLFAFLVLFFFFFVRSLGYVLDGVGQRCRQRCRVDSKHTHKRHRGRENKRSNGSVCLGRHDSFDVEVKGRHRSAAHCVSSQSRAAGKTNAASKHDSCCFSCCVLRGRFGPIAGTNSSGGNTLPRYTCVFVSFHTSSGE